MLSFITIEIYNIIIIFFKIQILINIKLFVKRNNLYVFIKKPFKLNESKKKKTKKLIDKNSFKFTRKLKKKPKNVNMLNF